MDQPMDYSGAFSNLPDPAQSFTQGLQGGAGLAQAQTQQVMQQMQMARQRSMWMAAQQVASNPTLQNVSQLSIAFPEISEQLGRSFNMLQPAQQQAKMQAAIPIYAAMQSGRYDVAKNLAQEQQEAYQNSGNDGEAQYWGHFADLIDSNPQHAHMAGGLMLASTLGPDKFKDTFSSLPAADVGFNSEGASTQKNQAEADVQSANAMTQLGRNQAEIGQIQSNVTNQAGRLQLDRDQLMSNTQLKLQELQLQYGKPPDSVRPVIDEAMTNAASSEAAANRYLDLANRMESSGLGHGLGGVASDYFAKATGTEDGAQALKQEFARIVNNTTLSQAKDSLGGRVTDTDMKVAMGPVPSPNADPSVVTAYLRGTAKLMQVAAAQNEAKGQWLAQSGQSGNLGRASTDMTIMGTRVPAGSNFADFSRQFLKQKADQIAQESAIINAQSRGYMKHAQGAPQGDGVPVLTGNPPAQPNSTNPTGWPDDTPIP